MKINIGTTKGNIVGVTVNKRFVDIRMSDIRDIVLKERGAEARIIGWAPTHKQGRKTKIK